MLETTTPEQTGPQLKAQKTSKHQIICTTNIELINLISRVLSADGDWKKREYLLSLRDITLCIVESLDAEGKRQSVGNCVKKDFGFCPVRAFRMTNDEIDKVFSDGESSFGEIVRLGEGSGKVLVERAGEGEGIESKPMYIVVRKSNGGCGMDLRIIDVVATLESEQISTLQTEKTIEAVVTLLENVKDLVSVNYAKYFVNNLMIVNADVFSNDEIKKICRQKTNSFIDANIKINEPEKTPFDQYMSNFNIRPFYGEALTKLPKHNESTDKFDWDELYINSELTSKELGLSQQ